MIAYQEARDRAGEWLRTTYRECDFLRVSADFAETRKSWLFCTVDKDGGLVAGGFAIIVNKENGVVRKNAYAWREFVQDGGPRFRFVRFFVRWWFSY